MPELMPATGSSRISPWLKYLGAFLIAFGLLLVCVVIVSVAFLGREIRPVIAQWTGGVPQISGTVVDALTGQPLSGMDVCLVARARGLDGARVDRSEVTQSDASGKFFFRPSIQTGFGFLGYQIEVADRAAQVGFSCGRYRDLLTNPDLLRREPSGSADDGKQFYFPLILVEGLPNDPNDHTDYGPLFQKFTDPGHIRVEMIPLLKSDDECDKMGDQHDATFCRQLNSSGDAALLRKRNLPSGTH